MSNQRVFHVGLILGVSMWLLGLIVGMLILAITSRLTGDAFFGQVNGISTNFFASGTVLLFWWWLPKKLIVLIGRGQGIDNEDAFAIGFLLAFINLVLDLLLHVGLLGPGGSLYFSYLAPWVGYVVLFISPYSLAQKHSS